MSVLSIASAFERAKDVLQQTGLNLRQNPKILKEIDGINNLSDSQYVDLMELACYSVSYIDKRVFSRKGYNKTKSNEVITSYRGACSRRGMFDFN